MTGSGMRTCMSDAGMPVRGGGAVSAMTISAMAHSGMIPNMPGAASVSKTGVAPAMGCAAVTAHA